MLRLGLQNIFETLFSNAATSGNKTIHTPPPPSPSFKNGVFSASNFNSDSTLHGGGGGREISFSPF